MKLNQQSTIRPATLADLPALIVLERRSSTAAHWSESQYHQAIAPEATGVRRVVLVVQSGSAEEFQPNHMLLGFLVARYIAPDWELENIIVDPNARRRGLGKRLLDALLAKARETNSESVFLEVRESNGSARALYESAGFHQTGRRKSYYSGPAEDAILYRLTLR